MTRGQRSGHLVLWLTLAPLAVALLVLALVFRPAAPTQDQLPQAILPPGGQP